MNKASPIDLRKAMEAAQALASCGILFVPMPADGAEEFTKRMEESAQRLEQLAVAAEQQGGAI